MKNPTDLNSKEKKIIIEELEDAKDHYSEMLESGAFNDSVLQKEDVIDQVQTIDSILEKLT